MKILVMSDSHGRRDLVKKIIQKHEDTAMVLHLGDVLEDVSDMPPLFPDRKFVWVRGNCDVYRDDPLHTCVTVDGVTLFMAHGHSFAVHYGLTALTQEALRRGAQICLYGHTHVPCNRYQNGLYIMNPGSLSRPRDSSRAGYGLIEICPEGIMTSLVTLDGRVF